MSKLSRLQWRILGMLVSREAAGRSPHTLMISRTDVTLERITEAERVAVLRTVASLIRRGLIERIDRESEPAAYKLAVPARALDLRGGRSGESQASGVAPSA